MDRVYHLSQRDYEHIQLCLKRGIDYAESAEYVEDLTDVPPDVVTYAAGTGAGIGTMKSVKYILESLPTYSPPFD